MLLSLQEVMISLLQRYKEANGSMRALLLSVTAVGISMCQTLYSAMPNNLQLS